MRWAEVSSGTVTEVTISETEEFGAAWLNKNVGGVWVEVPENVTAGPGFIYADGVFSEPPVYEWNEETQTWEPVSEA